MECITVELKVVVSGSVSSSSWMFLTFCSWELILQMGWRHHWSWPMVHLSVWPSTSRPQLRIQPHGSLGAASPGFAQGVAPGELHLFHATAVQHGRCGVDGGVGAQFGSLFVHTRMLIVIVINLPKLNNAPVCFSKFQVNNHNKYLRSLGIPSSACTDEVEMKHVFPTVSSSILTSSPFPACPFRGFRGCRCHAEGHASTISAILLRWDWET